MEKLKINRNIILSFFLLTGIVLSVVQILRASSGPGKPDPGHSWGEIECDLNLCVDTITGRVGVGTMAPETKLRIVDDTQTAAAQTVFSVSRQGRTTDGFFNNTFLQVDSFSGGTFATGGSHARLTAARGTRASPLALAAGDRIGTLLFAGFGTTLVNSAAISAFAEEAFTATAAGTNIRFETTPLGSTTRAERMRITAAGNVGIGTPTPATKLHIATTAPGEGVWVLGSGFSPQLVVGDTAATYLTMQWMSGVSPYGIMQTYIGRTASGTLSLQPTAGNVGIGTTMPTARVDVRGIDSGVAADQTIAVFSRSGAPDAANSFLEVQNFANHPSAGSHMRLVFGRGTKASPASTIEGDRIGSLLFTAYDSSTPPVMQNPAAIFAKIDGPVTAGHTPARLTFETGTTFATRAERMVITSGGNIGIGTTSPLFQLHIAKNVPNASTGFEIQDTSTGGKRWRVEVIGSGVAGRAGNFEFTEMGVGNHFVIRPGGNVGIGTTAPTVKLHVIGDFIATGFKSATVETQSFGKRKLYSVEAPTVRFIDEGDGRLVNGIARINIDPVFLETIEGELRVHVTPYGPAMLYVAERGKDYFIVKSIDGRDVEFSWQISAYRKGYSTVRLEKSK